MNTAVFVFDAGFDHPGYGFRFQIVGIFCRSEVGIHAAGIYAANTDMVFFCFLGEDLADAFHGILGGAVTSGHGIVEKAAAA